MGSGWRPLSKRGLEDNDWGQLYEGVPRWIYEDVIEWLRKSFVGRNGWHEPALGMCLRAIRAGRDRGESLAVAFDAAVRESESTLLDALDWRLGHREIVGDHRVRFEQLERLLLEGGSAWTSGPSGSSQSLHRRVESGTEAMAAAAMGPTDNASDYLSAAWSKAFGRDPDPSASYAESVRAVEAAARPVIAPLDDRATLGKMIATLRDASAKFLVVLKPDNGDAVPHVLSMMQLLWTSQLSRHGSDDSDHPLSATQSEAEAAATIAAALVQLFRSEAISRAD